MRIAFVGKGGSGKTTLAALFVRSLAEKQAKVFAIDADINQHLADALGLGESKKPLALSAQMKSLKTYLRGTNERFTPEEMIKTTPPGEGSAFFRLTDASLEPFVSCHQTVLFAGAGELSEEDVGIRCFHAKTGAVELTLNHLLDAADEFIVADMTAGADSFASGLFAAFDVTVIVVEPTKKSLDVFHQYSERARDYGVRFVAVGNKVRNEEDESYLRATLGLAYLGAMPWMEEIAREERHGAAMLAPAPVASLPLSQQIESLLISQPTDWQKRLATLWDFHARNAASWGNKSVGKDLSQQVDPSFRYPV